MKQSVMTAEFGSSADKVWNQVTDYTDYSWRSDLSNVQIHPEDGSYTETGKTGLETVFSVTLRIPHERYEMDFENKNGSGHFAVILQKNNGRSKVTFIRELQIKGGKSRLFLGLQMKRQQKRYVRDLKRALGEL
ncbi:MAG: SRPBCC family protein [Clostridiaceae bacterium]|nr:SRPBCC family protein [Clostridiaceae bacterium]